MSDLHVCYRQRMGLGARLTAISRADGLARSHRDVAGRILEAAKHFCTPPLPRTEDEFLTQQQTNLELTNQLTDLCAEHVSREWEDLRQSAQTTARRLAQSCSPDFADLLQEQLGRFCVLPAPTNHEELQAILQQRVALATRMTAISRADAMGLTHPAARETILNELRGYCKDPLPKSLSDFLRLQQLDLELTDRISIICHADMARQVKSMPAPEE